MPATPMPATPMPATPVFAAAPPVASREGEPGQTAKTVARKLRDDQPVASVASTPVSPVRVPSVDPVAVPMRVGAAPSRSAIAMEPAAGESPAVAFRGDADPSSTLKSRLEPLPATTRKFRDESLPIVATSPSHEKPRTEAIVARRVDSEPTGPASIAKTSRPTPALLAVTPAPALPPSSKLDSSPTLSDPTTIVASPTITPVAPPSAAPPSTVAARKPAVNTPAVSKPAVRTPASIESVATQPANIESVASKSVLSKPVMSEPVMSEPVLSKPVLSKPVFSSPGLNSAAASGLVSSSPAAGKAVASSSELPKPAVAARAVPQPAAALASSQVSKPHANAVTPAATSLVAASSRVAREPDLANNATLVRIPSVDQQATNLLRSSPPLRAIAVQPAVQSSPPVGELPSPSDKPTPAARSAQSNPRTPATPPKLEPLPPPNAIVGELPLLPEEMTIEGIDGEYCECCEDRMGFWELCKAIHEVGKNMPQHYPYVSEPWTYYYFRPYSYLHIAKQQQEAAGWGATPQQPYARKMFDRIYEDLAKEFEPPQPADDRDDR